MADTTGWVWHERYAWHDARGLMDSAPPGALFEPQPSLESGDTKRRMRNLIDASGLLAALSDVAPRPAGDATLRMIHDPAYVEEIRAASAAVGGDGGNWRRSAAAATRSRRSPRAACIARRGGLDGDVDNAYALVRPPGHHAERRPAACGFCVFANIALAALHARRRTASSASRSSTGTSTTATAPSTPSTRTPVLTISLHQDGLLPGRLGPVVETAAGRGAGPHVNVPLPPGSGDGAYRARSNASSCPALELRAGPHDRRLGLDASMMDPLGAHER